MFAQSQFRLAGNRATAFDFRSVAARKVGKQDFVVDPAQERVLSRNVAIQRNTGARRVTVATYNDFLFELPGFAVERAANDFQDIHH